MANSNPNGSLCDKCRQDNISSPDDVERCLAEHHRLNTFPLFRLDNRLTERFGSFALHDFQTMLIEEYQYMGDLDVPTFGHEHTIHIDLDINGASSMPLVVRQFKPCGTDVLDRRWIGEDGEPWSVRLAPFAVADIHNARHAFETFVDSEWLKVNDEPYRLVGRLYDALRQSTAADGTADDDEDDTALVGKLGCFAIACLCKIGSASISGQDTLGMAPPPDRNYPLGQRVSVPRMVTAQIDRMITRCLTFMQQEVYEHLVLLLKSEGVRKPEQVFLTFATLSDLVSRMRADMARHARDNSAQTTFTHPKTIERAESELNCLLTMLHRFDTPRALESTLSEWSPGVRTYYESIKEMGNEEGTTGWWLRQLTEESSSWRPKPTFYAEPEAVTSSMGGWWPAVIVVWAAALLFVLLSLPPSKIPVRFT